MRLVPIARMGRPLSGQLGMVTLMWSGCCWSGGSMRLGPTVRVAGLWSGLPITATGTLSGYCWSGSMRLGPTVGIARLLSRQLRAAASLLSFCFWNGERMRLGPTAGMERLSSRQLGMDMRLLHVYCWSIRSMHLGLIVNLAWLWIGQLGMATGLWSGCFRSRGVEESFKQGGTDLHVFSRAPWFTRQSAGCFWCLNNSRQQQQYSNVKHRHLASQLHDSSTEYKINQ